MSKQTPVNILLNTEGDLTNVTFDKGLNMSHTKELGEEFKICDHDFNISSFTLVIR